MRSYGLGYLLGMRKSAVTVQEPRPWYLRPVSSTVGRISDPFTALVLGTTSPLKGAPTKKDIEEVLEDYPDLSDEVDVQLGSSRPLRNLARILKRKDISIPTKAWGAATSLPREALKPFLRADSYDPFANVVTLYHKDPAIAAHELGHAEDYLSRSYPGLWAAGYQLIPILRIYQEYLASKKGVTRMLERGYTREQIQRANRVLGAALGSYVGAATGAYPVAVLAGGAIGKGLQPFGKKKEEGSEKRPAKPVEKETSAKETSSARPEPKALRKRPAGSD